MQSASSDTVASELKVVIVEDSPNMQVALQELVDSVGGLQVVALEATASSAIDWADQHPGGWDVAIIDLTLEEGDGFEIIRRFAEQPDRGHMVVYSAYVTPVIRRYCGDLGADVVFRKEESAQLASYMEKLQPRTQR
jgi:DNA-binding NarL/FixJ family response regulator